MKQVLYFSLGAAVGGALGYYMTRRYYEQLIDDEIESVKEAYADADEKAEERYQRAKEAMKEYGAPGGNYSNVERLDLMEQPEEEEEEPKDANPFPGEKVDEPYVITPDSYHEEFTDVVDKETLTYWAGSDTLVTDEDEELVIEDMVGRECLGRFGEYESDTVYVRNERLGMDFEIVYMEGEYNPE